MNSLNVKWKYIVSCRSKLWYGPKQSYQNLQPQIAHFPLFSHLCTAPTNVIWVLWNILNHWPISPKRLVCLQIEDVADGAVKPPPNKIPIFFFGTHETWVHVMCCVRESLVIPLCTDAVDFAKTFFSLPPPAPQPLWRGWHFHTGWIHLPVVQFLSCHA